MPATEPRPCEVCGAMTRSKYGCRRTPECRRESSRRWREINNPRTKQYEPCELCGQPTYSATKVCWRPSCRAEQKRRDARINQEARLAAQKQWRQANKERVAANKAAWLLANKERMEGYHREYGRRWREENPEAVRASQRRGRAKPEATQRRRAFFQRTDRPCKYAKTGCTEFAGRGSALCHKHDAADAMRRWRRKRKRLAGKLAAAQSGRCPWCSQALPDDHAGTHIDHIIPKASGYVIDEEWNLQLLHKLCNLSKNDKITPQAIALAAEHGIELRGIRVTTCG